MRYGLVIAIVLLAASSAAAAHAHFGAPEVTGLHIQPEDPRRWLAVSNIGPIVSDDGGNTFRWICHNAITKSAHFEFDYIWLPDGDILGATGEMIRTRDGGCTWDTLPGFEGLEMTVLAQHPTERSQIFAASAANNAQNVVFRSRDGGDTFAPVLERWSFFFTISLAPSTPDVVYISGFSLGGRASLFRSRDGGDTFTEIAFDMPAPGGYRVLGVHPQNPDVVFTTFLGRPDGVVYRSRDGGETLTPVLELDEHAGSIAFDTDNRIWIASDTHIFRSDDGGDTFMPLSTPSDHTCIT